MPSRKANQKKLVSHGVSSVVALQPDIPMRIKLRGESVQLHISLTNRTELELREV